MKSLNPCEAEWIGSIKTVTVPSPARKWNALPKCFAIALVDPALVDPVPVARELVADPVLAVALTAERTKGLFAHVAPATMTDPSISSFRTIHCTGVCLR
jgi:hypothetical protein